MRYIVGSVSPLLDGEPIGILGVRAECLVAELRTKFRKAFVKRAFDGAIAAGQEADRPRLTAEFREDRLIFGSDFGDRVRRCRGEAFREAPIA